MKLKALARFASSRLVIEFQFEHPFCIRRNSSFERKIRSDRSKLARIEERQFWFVQFIVM